MNSKDFFTEGIILIQDIAWDIINSNNKDYVDQKARLINCLCNQFLEEIEKCTIDIHK